MKEIRQGIIKSDKIKVMLLSWLEIRATRFSESIAIIPISAPILCILPRYSKHKPLSQIGSFWFWNECQWHQRILNSQQKTKKGGRRDYCGVPFDSSIISKPGNTQWQTAIRSHGRAASSITPDFRPSGEKTLSS